MLIASAQKEWLTLYSLNIDLAMSIKVLFYFSIWRALNLRIWVTCSRRNTYTWLFYFDGKLLPVHTLSDGSAVGNFNNIFFVILGSIPVCCIDNKNMNVLYYYENMISLVSHCCTCSITKLQYFGGKFKFKALTTIILNSSTVQVQMTSHMLSSHK